MQTIQVTKNFAFEIPDSIKVYGADQVNPSCATEDDDLISIVAFLKYRHPKIERLLWHIPNESMMPVQGRVRAKRKGLKAGAPDLMILTNPLVCLELKREDPKKSFPNAKARAHFHEQIEVLNEVSRSGHTSVVAFGYKGFMDFYDFELKTMLTELGL